MKKCILCGETYSGADNNPAPLSKIGKCCNTCCISVLFARILSLRESKDVQVYIEKNIAKQKNKRRRQKTFSEWSFVETNRVKEYLKSGAKVSVIAKDPELRDRHTKIAIFSRVAKIKAETKL